MSWHNHEVDNTTTSAPPGVVDRKFSGAQILSKEYFAMFAPTRPSAFFFTNNSSSSQCLARASEQPIWHARAGQMPFSDPICVSFFSLMVSSGAKLHWLCRAAAAAALKNAACCLKSSGYDCRAVSARLISVGLKALLVSVMPDVLARYSAELSSTTRLLRSGRYKIQGRFGVTVIAIAMCSSSESSMETNWA